MSVSVLNDNISLDAPKALERKYARFAAGVQYPYTNIAQAQAAFNSVYRSVGLTQLIYKDGIATEYWYRDGVADGDLIPKIVALTLTTSGSSGASTYNSSTNTLNIPIYTDVYTGTVTSVAVSISGALAISGSPITTSGTLTFSWQGITSQYIRGDGSLATFPTLTSGTVTSVSLTMPTGFSVSGSPITSSGTLSVNTSLSGILIGTGTGFSTATIGTGLTYSSSTLSWNGVTGRKNGGSDVATRRRLNFVEGSNVTVDVVDSGTDLDITIASTASGGGGGTVTSFSSGNLSPLFTTLVTTSTTTPALSFTLSNAAAHTFFGNFTGSTGAPSFSSPSLASGDFSNQGTSTTVLHGNASGNPSWTQVLTADIATSNVTYAKIQDVTASSFLVRYTGSNGVVQEGTFGSGLSLNSSTGVLTSTGLGGTVTSVSSTSADLNITGSPITTSGTLDYTLKTVNSNVGTYGDSTHIAQITVNGKGLTTAISSVSISFPVTSVSNSDSTLIISPITGNVISSLNLSNANTWLATQTFSTSTISITGGTSGYVLSTNGSGSLSWVAAGGTGTVTSVAATITSSTALSISGSPITTNGTLAFTWTGISSQYIKGDGTLGTSVFGTVTSVSGSGGTTGLTLTGGAITTTGTLTLGGTLITSNGGTGLTTYTAGDLLTYSSGTVLSKIAIGTANQLLRVNSGATAFEWFTPSYITGNQSITFTPSGDVTGSSSGTTSLTPTLVIGTDKVTTTKILNSNVTYAKIQDVTTQTLLGRYAGTNGVTQEITIGTGLALNSSTGVLSSTANVGTVTSVGISGSDFVITSSPITTSGTIGLTLATVNSNVGTFNNFTVNGKGLITSASNASYLTSAVTSITGTNNQILVSASTGAVILSTPQDIATISDVGFHFVTASGIGANTGGGQIVLRSSNSSNAGYIEIYKGDNTTRLGYIGLDNTDLMYTSENGAKHNFSGNIVLSTIPTTSAGTYDILTRNTSTGIVEKTAISGFIFNQFSAAQTADYWINGRARIETYIGVNTTSTANRLAVSNINNTSYEYITSSYQEGVMGNNTKVGLIGQSWITNSSSFTQTSQRAQVGTYGSLVFNNSGAITLLGTKGVYAGTLGQLAFRGTANVSGDFLSGVMSISTLANSGNVPSLAALYVLPPYQEFGQTSYSGTLSNWYGLYISDGYNSDVSSKITNRYGIYQAGTGDINKFFGDVYIDKAKNGTGVYMLTIQTDGRVTSQAISSGTVLSGTYTPTLTNTTNISSSTSYVCQYMRIDNVVTVSGKVDVTPTSNPTNTELRFTLPISSNFTADQQVAGTGLGGAAAVPSIIYSLSGGSLARMIFVSNQNFSTTFYFSFTYQII